MCLILLAYDSHPDYAVVFASNRDEFYERPAEAAHFWPDAPRVLAGRDEEAGGTWCGVDTKRRFAAVTNYREKPVEGEFCSRGDLVADFLKEDVEPEEYLSRIAPRADKYRGFNLLIGDIHGIHYFSNRGEEQQILPPGVHGLSNDVLNGNWFKVREGKRELRRVLKEGPTAAALFDVLADEQFAPEADLPDSGFGRRWERMLSSRFIRTETYGTRCSTVILIDRYDNLEFYERTFRPGEAHHEERSYLIRSDAPVAQSN